MKYIIEGGKKLEGEVKISGNKNSILPCIAAALLTSEEVILQNVPGISDVDVFVDMLKEMGIEAVKEGDRLKISGTNISNTNLSSDLMKKVRASIMFVGPLLARAGRVEFTHPGGDVIGKRSIGVHLEGFTKLGAQVNEINNGFEAILNKNEGSQDFNLFLDEPSQTGTSNLILAAVLGRGTVTLRNCAKEPANIDLCQMLNSMGALIEGIGTDRLVIKGVDSLHGTEYRVFDDFTEIGTYAIAAAITGGRIKIVYNLATDLEPVYVTLRKFGVNIEIQGDGVLVSAEKLKSVDVIKTNIWPGFPTDLMSVLIVLATQAEGVTLCHDWMYESRMFFTDKLISMGAKIVIADPHRVLVYGPSKLRAKDQETPDIRAGMALVLAALIAEGKSTIQKAELIERGYEDAVSKLSALGANISRAE